MICFQKLDVDLIANFGPRRVSIVLQMLDMYSDLEAHIRFNNEMVTHQRFESNEIIFNHSIPAKSRKCSNKLCSFNLSILRWRIRKTHLHVLPFDGPPLLFLPIRIKQIHHSQQQGSKEK
jgi:hypothetical protein